MSTTGFVQFVRRYGPGILCLLVRWTRNHDEALDLQQNALLKSVVYFQQNGVLPPFLWLKTVARREYCSWRRKRKLEPLPVGFDLEKESEDTMAEEERSMVMLSVLKLPPPYRDIINLHYIEGWPLARIEEEKGIPISTAKTRLHRARLLLAEKLIRFQSN